MASGLVSYVGWAFLPGLVSGWVQSIYYGIVIRAGDQKPQPGTPRYQKHRRRIQSAVILAYLLYTIYEADYQLRQETDFYQILGVPHDEDEKKIKSRFRRLAALYHPDKLPSDASPTARSAAETHFVTLQSAQKTLSDPIKRFAYERFGPDILTWTHCSSIRDYLTRGLQVVQLPLYAGTALVLIGLSFTNYLLSGRFWRYLFFAALLLLEMHTVSRPYFPPILTKVINPILDTKIVGHPPLLPFQLLILARKATVVLFMAFSQLSSLYPPRPLPSSTSTSSASAIELQQLNRLEQSAQTSDAEASRLLQLDMAPFVGDEAGTKELRGRMREWLVNNAIRADPEVRDAVGKALGRRRVGAPAGAR